MRGRGCLISAGALVGLVLICCLAVWFVGIPRFQGWMEEGLSEGISTEVAQQLDSAGGDLAPGTHTVDMAQLESELADVGNLNPDDFEMTASNGQISIRFGQTGQQVGYIGDVSAENGRLVVSNMESTEGGLDFLLPPDRLENAIENGVNNYFAARGLSIQSVTADNNQITVDTVPAGA